MAAINCPRCGKLFNKIMAPVCPACEKLEEEKFNELRKYIEDNPFAGINEISDATEVPTKRILNYIREGRLIVSQGLSGELRCSKCGRQILEGNFCSDCSNKMASNLGASIGVNVNPPKQAAPAPAAAPAKKSSGFHVGRK